MEILSLSFLEMGGDGAVERDGSGLPRSWPILKVGDNVATRSAGMPVNIRLTRDDLAAIVDYHAAKRTIQGDGNITLAAAESALQIGATITVDGTDFLITKVGKKYSVNGHATRSFSGVAPLATSGGAVTSGGQVG